MAFMFFSYPLDLLSERITISVAVVTNELAPFYCRELLETPDSVGHPGASTNDLDMDFLKSQYSCYVLTSS
jgi:hypothetical protein